MKEQQNYKLLNTVNKTDEWEDWILYILKAIEETSNKTIIKINSIKELLDNTIKIAQEKASKIYRKELTELLFEQPYSKIEFVIDKLGVERKASSRYLKKLEEIGILESQKVGRETIYVNSKLIDYKLKMRIKNCYILFNLKNSSRLWLGVLLKSLKNGEFFKTLLKSVFSGYERIHF